MEIQFTLNKKQVTAEVGPDTVLLGVLRDLGCKSVKCGCETTLAASVGGHEITTLEGVEEEAAEFGRFLAAEGGEQCGFCSPGFIMNVLAMKKELEDPDLEEIKEYLAGNLCRCTGYMSQLRAIQKYMAVQKEKDGKEAMA